VGFVLREPKDPGPAIFAPVPDGSMKETLERCREDQYYCLDGRILVALDGAGRLSEATGPPPTSLIGELYSRIDKTGLLLDGEPGYPHGRQLYGVVVEGDDAGGQRRVFVGVQGGQLSNDHYPYYEFLFAWPADGRTPSLLFANRFFYDIAGIEGLEWPYLFVVFAVTGILVTVPLALSMCLVWRWCRLTLRPRGGPA